MARVPVQIIALARRLKKAVAKELAVKKLILFGSYAKGNHTTDSDIDLCIVADNAGNNSLAALKLAPLTAGIDTRIEAIVFNERDFRQGTVGIIREIKETGIEIE
ncbi:MAG TPA: nucleotidyltransferase domain-containing protein [bacterium]|nr:nucleotidyltransferase domain-containing protein [bacterium]